MYQLDKPCKKLVLDNSLQSYKNLSFHTTPPVCAPLETTTRPYTQLHMAVRDQQDLQCQQHNLYSYWHHLQKSSFPQHTEWVQFVQPHNMNPLHTV